MTSAAAARAGTQAADSTLRSRAAAVALVALVPAGVAVARLAPGVLPGCPLRALTGLDCPLCGGTRAAVALAHGRVLQAFDHNLLVTTVVLPALVVALVMVAGRVWRGRPVRLGLPPGWAVLALVVFGVVRNLPFWWAEPLRSSLQP